MKVASDCQLQIAAQNKQAVEMGECEQPPSCITEHPGFQAVCLDKWVLQAAWYHTCIRNNVTSLTMVQMRNIADILHTVNLCDGAGELLARKLGCRCPIMQFVELGATFPLHGWRRNFYLRDFIFLMNNR